MEDIYKDIRPYRDSEVNDVFKRVCQEPDFEKVLHLLFPEKANEYLILFSHLTNIYDFQSKVVGPFLMELSKKTTDGVEINGLEACKNENKYCYMSNHRDIILDAAHLNTLMIMNGMDTAENAIGDNLCAKPWLTELMKLNKNFIVKRSGTKREIFNSSIKLSQYIREQITQRNDSIWIAEREGRAKDSNDLAQESVLKMFTMSSGKNMKQGFMELNIVPVSISYEFDGCDYLKAQEFQQKRDDAEWKKTKADDLHSMKTGMIAYKGHIHYEVTPCINAEIEQQVADDADRATAIKTVRELIDQHIHSHYRIYANNWVALDERNGNEAYKDKYSAEEKKRFDDYLKGQIAKIELANKEEVYLREKILEMYSNPLINYLKATQK